MCMYLMKLYFLQILVHVRMLTPVYMFILATNLQCFSKSIPCFMVLPLARIM